MRHQEDGATSDEHFDKRAAGRRVDPNELSRESARTHDDDLATIPSAVFVFGASGRIEDVNRLAETLVGYSRSKLIGHGVDLVLSSAARATRGVRRVQFLHAAQDVVAHHCNGRDIPVDVLLCPHGHGSTMAIVRAVSEPEPEVLRKDAIEQIAHDLRSPLCTIGLESNLLDEVEAAGGRVEIRPALARIARNVAYLERMVQELLDASSIASRRFEIQRRPTELRSLIEQLVDRLVPTRDRQRVVLDTPCPLTLSIDALRIERVVANLVQNALKYAPHGSRIVVRLDVDRGHARVSVTDVGPGMTPAETAYVFDKYRRTPAACLHEGAGIGLYVSKQIIEAHGGTIGVDSILGAGSRFFFELPVT